MNIREISVARLKEYENNPRNNDLAVEKVKYSIERFGFLFPVVVDMNYTIVCGHTRVRACRELGIQTVPCIIADELTDEQINLFRLVDKSVQIVTHGSRIILLDDLHNDGTIRLFGLLHNFVLRVISLQISLVLFNFILDLLDCIKMLLAILQHKVQGLANAGGFYSFHV